MFVMLLGGVGLAGGSARVGQLPSQQIMSVVDNIPEQSCMADTFLMTAVFCPFGSNGGWSPVLIATAQWVQSTSLGRVEELKPLFYTLPLALLELGLSITFQPVDTALSIIRIANDISNWTVG